MTSPTGGVAIVIPRPSSEIDVFGLCQQVEQHAQYVTDVAELQNAKAKLSAIDAYLERTSTEGRRQVSATMRRLEVRIGELLPPVSETNGRNLSLADERSGVTALTPNERRDFRDMAANVEAVESVIADSTDEEPASRRKVLTAVRAGHQCDTCGEAFAVAVWECETCGSHLAYEHHDRGDCKYCDKPAFAADPPIQPKAPKPAASRRRPITDQARDAGWDFRKLAERLERIGSDDRFPQNREQVAAHLRGHLTFAIEVCQDLLDRFDHCSKEGQ